MARDYQKALAERKTPPEERRTTTRRYVGLIAAFTPDHPSVQAVEGLAVDLPTLRSYLEVTRALPRPVKTRIARNFYPQGEEPVDFLEVHPLKGDIERLAATPEIERIEAFLEANEREHVVALGGLHILGTERHEARRIDNQLRGRAGRQGDAGSSRFYLSLEDDLMRIFGSDRISGLMLRLGMEEGVPIEHGMVTKSIERAQKQVEAQNFSIRKHLLEYDDVMNKQREAIYGLRRLILEGKQNREYIMGLAREVLEWYLEEYAPENKDPEHWSLETLQGALKETFGLEASLDELKGMGRGDMAEQFLERVRIAYEAKERQVGAELMAFHQRMIMLQIVDTQWKDHLYALDHLKEGIGLRGYAQRDPLVEYKKESYEMFRALTNRIDEEILRWMFLYQPVAASPEADLPPEEPPAPREPRPRRPLPRTGPPAAGGGLGELGLGGGLAATPRALPRNLTFNDPSEALSGSRSAFAGAERKEAHGGNDGEVQTVRREGRKVGRNDPCPCGSGKKYKKCHGAT
jgi:preprotein translocase subunit SecA